MPEHGDGEELEDEGLDQLGLEDVAQRDPVQEFEEGVEGGANLVVLVVVVVIVEMTVVAIVVVIVVVMVRMMVMWCGG